MSPASPGTGPARASFRSTLRRSGWTFRRTAALLALAAGAVLATSDAWRDIVDLALHDEEQSHVLLAPLVAAWLVWVRRERLRGYCPSATWMGPLVVALGWALNRVGDTYLFQSMWHLGAILVLVGAVLAVAGGGLVIRFFPAFVALCFMVPAPALARQAVAIPLQRVTAEVTQAVLETLGVAVERFGSTLRINEQDVMIAEACNGLRMVFALVIVTFAFAYGAPLRDGFRVAVLVLSPLTAIAFNVLRLVPVVWAYGSLPADVAGSIHDLSGWAMLPAALATLLVLMRLMRWAHVPVTHYVLAYGS